MRLEKFVLKINSEIIREIIFKDGLNLITNDKKIGRTGNSVGKSTLSRIIDFLFLGSIDSIYLDPEFKKPNIAIQELFSKSLVEVSLFYKDFEDALHSISRNLTLNDDEKYYFDSKTVDKVEYEEKILETIFKITSKNPTLRRVAPKFIRNDSHRMLNTTSFLDKNAGHKDYSEIFYTYLAFKILNYLL